MPRPALLLDVDGVLNPYGTVTCPEGFTEYDLFPGKNLSGCARHTGKGSPSSGTYSTSPGPQPGTMTATACWPLLIPVAPAAGLTRQAVGQALTWAGCFHERAGLHLW